MDIDTPYALTATQIRFYREKGFVKLKDVFRAETLNHYGREITKKVFELNTLHLPMEQRTTYQKAFLQVMNIWRESERVKAFVFGKRLARLAAELMGTRPARGCTTTRRSTRKGRAASRPGMPTSTTGRSPPTTPSRPGCHSRRRRSRWARSPPGSQRLDVGRELSISDQSQQKIEMELMRANLGQFEEAFDLGEVSFHSGWTFHRAGPNLTDRPREVMTVIYMDEDMRLATPTNQNQQQDWDAWCPGVKVGERIQSPINPVIWSSRK